MLDDPLLWAVFITESKEQVQYIRDGLLRLEGDPENLEVIGNMCNNAHSLKGSAQMMNLQDVARFARGLEYLLRSIQQKEVVFGEAIGNGIEGQLNVLTQLIEGVDSEKPLGENLESLGTREENTNVEEIPVSDAGLSTILLVDDTETVRIRAQHILQDGGYGVVTAVDGLDALRKLEDQAFAGVMTDIEMPDMDGLTLTRKIRANPKFAKLPILIVSSLSGKTDLQKGLDAGANAYLTKSTSGRGGIVDKWRELLGDGSD